MTLLGATREIMTGERMTVTPLLPLLVVGFCTWRYGFDISLQPDSVGYLEFFAIRPAAYPIFLKLVRFVGGDHDFLIGYAQLALFLVSMHFLCGALATLIGNRLFPNVLFLLSCANPFLLDLHFAVLSDSLFASLVVLVLAGALRFHRSGRTADAVLLGCLVGLAIAVRPLGWALAGFMLVLLAGPRDARSRGSLVFARNLAGAVVATTALIAAEAMLHARYHPGPRPNLTGILVFGKAALVANRPIAESPTDPLTPLRDALRVEAQPARDLIASVPDWNLRAFLTERYEGYFQYKFKPDLIARLSRETGLDRNQVRMEAAWKRLEAASGDYFALSWRHYLSLWSPAKGSLATTVASLDKLREQEGELLFETEILPAGSEPRPRFHAWPIQQAIRIIGMLSAIACLPWIVAMVTRRSRCAMLASASLCGILLHGYTVLIALANFPTYRYMAAVWPIQLAFVVILLAWLARITINVVPRRR